MIKETEYFRVFDQGFELTADFLTRKGTHDQNIVQEVWNEHFYYENGFEIKPGDRVVDIGAHIGSFTVWAMKKGADVLAFEPDRDNFNLLAHNVNFNRDINKDKKIGEVEAHPYAVKAIEGIYFIDRGSEGQPNTGGYKIVDEMTAPSVEGVQSIDPEMIFEGGKRVDFLKIDCEGSEYEIIEYMAREGLLKLVDKIVLEWHFDKEKAFKLRDTLEANGFFIRELSTNEKSPEPLGRIMARK